MAAVMGYKITWWNENLFEDGFRVYRHTSSFTESNLPAVYETLPPRTTEFVDSNVNSGVTYYYRISTFYNSSEGEVELFHPSIVSMGVSDVNSLIGSPQLGGYYVGNITVPAAGGANEGTYMIIAMGREAEPSGTLQWRTSNTSTPGTSSTVDGLGNTEAMMNINPDLFPAARYCWNMDYEEIDGLSRPYLPAPNELDLLWINRNQAGLGAALQMRSEWYWTSRESNANTAYCQYFSNGYKSNDLKTTAFRVRPVRRIKIG